MSTIIKTVLCGCLAIVGAGCPDSEDCEVRTCGIDLAAGRKTNGKAYERCFSGGGGSTPLTTTLVGEDGNEFFECTDEPGRSCLEGSVNAQFAYCEVQ